jgi:ribonuclease P protein component
VAVIVSKKVVKAAPKRNRIRRRIFEVLRSDWQQIAEHQDVIITVQSPEFLVMGIDDLRHEVGQLLAQARLLRSDQTAPESNRDVSDEKKDPS